MDTILFLGSIIIFIVVMIGFLIYEYYENKRHEEKMRKEQEEWERKIKDPEYIKKREKELENSLTPYNTGYHVLDDPYYTSDFPHTKYISRHDDSFYDITSPYCPYGMWTWN